MGSLFSRVFRTTPPTLDDMAEDDPHAALSLSAADRPVDRGSVTDSMFRAAFAFVVDDETDPARDIVRNLSPRDRVLLSFVLEEMTRIVSEEEDFRRTTDRRAARLSAERRESASLEDIVEGHLRDI